jgi:PTS system glucitol/sorbitol-specific IIA component
MVKFEGQITAVGPHVSEFINSKLLVLFAEGAPEELSEFSILHNANGLAAPLAAGDTFYLDTTGYHILAVGEIANDNLASLGHVVLKFNGLLEPEMPGDICLEVQDIPSVEVGMSLRIEGRNDQ